LRSLGDPRTGFADRGWRAHARRFARIRACGRRLQQRGNRSTHTQKCTDFPARTRAGDRRAMVRGLREASGGCLRINRCGAGSPNRNRAGRIRYDALIRTCRTNDSRDGTLTRKIAAVIFDWAGTTVDHGSLAPVRVLRRVFESRGVPISEAEARRDMGVLKRDHIQRIVLSPAVSERWRVKTGRPPGEKDVDALFADFVPLQLECLVRDSAVIDGVAETVARLRKRGIKIGSTTGYTREMMELLAPAAAAGGYHPDCVVTPDDVGGGRPHPWMIFQNAIRLRIDDLSSIVKVGDTISDIEEGLNAGVWTIGVARTG